MKKHSVSVEIHLVGVINIPAETAEEAKRKVEELFLDQLIKQVSFSDIEIKAKTK